MGSETVWVVHGDGLDGMTTTGTTQVVALENGEIREFTITPEECGLNRVDLSELKGGDGVYNAKALRAVLEGEKNAYREIVLLNSAASLIIAGKAETMTDGVEMAAKSIDSGAALATLEKLVTVSKAQAPKKEA